MLLNQIPDSDPLGFEAASAGDTTTTSIADVLLAGCSITPGAGDYLAWFSVSSEGSIKDVDMVFSLYVNGVQIPESERVWGIKNPDVPKVVATNAKIVGLAAGQVIDVRWRVGGGTGTAHHRTLNLLKIGG